MSPCKLLIITVLVLVSLSLPGPENRALASRRLLAPAIPDFPGFPTFGIPGVPTFGIPGSYPRMPGGFPNYGDPRMPGGFPNYGDPRDFPGGMPNFPGYPGSMPYYPDPSRPGFPGFGFPGNFPGGQPNNPNEPILPPQETTKTGP